MKFVVTLLSTLSLLSIIAGNAASTQTGIGIQIYPGTNIIGSVGSVYSIQATTNTALPNSWTTVAVVKLVDTNYLWFDTSFPTSPQSYYRTVAFTNVLTNMVFISAGTFLMGSPATEQGHDSGSTVSGELQHSVTISKGFFMGKYPVTQSEYASVMGTNPSHFNFGTNGSNPVEQINRGNAKQYYNQRTTNEWNSGAIPTNWVYRLPTEAEWEYACRAGSTAAFYFGPRIRSGMADFNGTNEYDSTIGTISNPSGINLQSTRPVGTYFPNAWGLYDMAGNVAQFTFDNDPLIYPTGSVTDPGLHTSNFQRFSNVRGGSWNNNGSFCRSAHRTYLDTGIATYSDVGFRVVLVPAQ